MDKSFDRIVKAREVGSGRDEVGDVRRLGIDRRALVLACAVMEKTGSQLPYISDDSRMVRVS